MTAVATLSVDQMCDRVRGVGQADLIFRKSVRGVGSSRCENLRPTEIRGTGMSPNGPHRKPRDADPASQQMSFRTFAKLRAFPVALIQRHGELGGAELAATQDVIGWVRVSYSFRQAVVGRGCMFLQSSLRDEAACRQWTWRQTSPESLYCNRTDSASAAEGVRHCFNGVWGRGCYAARSIRHTLRFRWSTGLHATDLPQNGTLVSGSISLGSQKYAPTSRSFHRRFRKTLSA